MKKICKEKKALVPDENQRFLKRLRDENEAFIKLVKQLEAHNSSNQKPTSSHKPEV